MNTIDIYPTIQPNTFPVSLVDVDRLSFMTATANTTCSTYNAPAKQSGYINDVCEEGYQVLNPIPYTIERVGDVDFVASIEDANITIGGTSWHDAYQALVADLLDTFDALGAEQGLGPEATTQLATLNTYLVKTA
jgi:hypothetical protein